MAARGAPRAAGGDLPDHAVRRRPDRAAERGELLPALRSLPPGQRAVMVLRYFEDLSEAQTAAALGVAVGTVKSQHARGIASLRRVLTRAGPRRHPAGRDAMTDVFDELLRGELDRAARGVVPRSTDPTGAIMARSRRTQRRRALVAVGSAAVVSVLAVGGVAVLRPAAERAPGPLTSVTPPPTGPTVLPAGPLTAPVAWVSSEQPAHRAPASVLHVPGRAKART